MSAGRGSDTSIGRLARLAPGVGVLVALAGAVTLVAGFVPSVNTLLFDVLLGAVVANTVGVPDWMRPGADTQKLLLETDIVLPGARIAADELVASGPVLVGLVVTTIAAGVLLVEAVVGCVFGLADKTGSLLAAGANVCDASAAATIAGTIDADGESFTRVVAVIPLFNALTFAAFPVAGDLLPLSGRQSSIRASLNMFSTDPVTTTGFTHSEVAGCWVTITELARNSMLDFVAVACAVHCAGRTERVATDLQAVLDGIPRSLVGFIAITAVANLGLLSDTTLATVDTASDTLFALAFVDLGSDIRLGAVRRTGATPLTVLDVQLLTVSTLALAAVLALF